MRCAARNVPSRALQQAVSDHVSRFAGTQRVNVLPLLPARVSGHAVHWRKLTGLQLWDKMGYNNSHVEFNMQDIVRSGFVKQWIEARDSMGLV